MVAIFSVSFLYFIIRMQNLPKFLQFPFLFSSPFAHLQITPSHHFSLFFFRRTATLTLHSTSGHTHEHRSQNFQRSSFSTEHRRPAATDANPRPLTICSPATMLTNINRVGDLCDGSSKSSYCPPAKCIPAVMEQCFPSF